MGSTAGEPPAGSKGGNYAVNPSARLVHLLAPAMILAAALSAPGQNPRLKKVYMITDMEGVDGIFSGEDQVEPFKSPRWEESRRLLAGEVNAALAGLYDAGATDVVVLDGHDGSRTLSALDIHPPARLLAGSSISPTLELDASFSALIFIGQHARAGAQKGVLSHSHSSESIQNFWINDKPEGEIGVWVMVAGAFGIPAIMLSGDAAACQEIHQLSPQAECAEVKSGVGHRAGFTLSHAAACALIREKARRAMERLPEFKPYKIAGPVEIKVEFTPEGTRLFPPRLGVERLSERTYVIRGKDILDAWLKYF